MNTFIRFFYEFISVFFDGLFNAFKGFAAGIIQMGNYKEYGKIIDSYKDSFNGQERIFVILSVVCLLIIVGLIVSLIILFFKKVLRRATTKMSKEEMLNEIASLNDQVTDLMHKNDDLMAMKVSQLGLNPEKE